MENQMMETCMWCKGRFKKIDGPTHKYIESIPGCWHTYNLVLTKEYENFSELNNIHRLTVDTYAVQHPGQPTRKSIQSVCGHLVSIYYILEEGLTGDAARKKLKQFIEAEPDLKRLDPPDFSNSLTIDYVIKAKTLEEHKKYVFDWAQSVWNVWKEKHKNNIYKLIKS